MQTIVRSDFQQLCRFTQTYSLSQVAQDPRYIALLSRIHKKYFALLVCLSELTTSGYALIAAVRNLTPACQVDMSNYMGESVSDLGIALFSWMHGSYKPMRLLIRSSIENFTRGISAVEDPTIVNENIVSTLFARASRLTLFAAPPVSSLFAALKTTYGVLCADVHTTEPSTMQHISSLNHFPAFDSDKATTNCIVFSNTCQQILSVTCVSFRDAFFTMHPTNRDLILRNLTQTSKLSIHTTQYPAP